MGTTAVTIPPDETATVYQPDGCENLEEIVTEIGLTSHRPILATETEIGTTAVTEPPAETVAELDDCHTEEWKSSNSCDSPLTVEEIVTENVVASAVGSNARSMDEDRQHEIIPTIMNPTEPVIEIDQRQYYQKQLKEPVAGHANSSVLDQPKQGESKFHDPVRHREKRKRQYYQNEPADEGKFTPTRTRCTKVIGSHRYSSMREGWHCGYSLLLLFWWLTLMTAWLSADSPGTSDRHRMDTGLTHMFGDPGQNVENTDNYTTTTWKTITTRRVEKHGMRWMNCNVHLTTKDTQAAELWEAIQQPKPPPKPPDIVFGNTVHCDADITRMCTVSRTEDGVPIGTSTTRTEQCEVGAAIRPGHTAGRAQRLADFVTQ